MWYSLNIKLMKDRVKKIFSKIKCMNKIYEFFLHLGIARWNFDENKINLKSWFLEIFFFTIDENYLYLRRTRHQRVHSPPPVNYLTRVDDHRSRGRRRVVHRFALSISLSIPSKKIKMATVGAHTAAECT